jgi:hypothetical protein
MITDKETNFLYLADMLPKNYPIFFENFEKVLNSCNIPFSLIPDTKDIWAVDYMPIQIETGKFVLLELSSMLKTLGNTQLKFWIIKLYWVFMLRPSPMSKLK